MRLGLWRHSYLLLVPLVPWLQGRVEGRLGEWRAQDEVLYVWSGEHVRRMSAGFENLMADVYWLRTVQYFGSLRAFAPDKKFDLLLPLVDITTTLDPRMEVAYRYGATFLAEPWPVGAGRKDDAVKLLERGTQHLPNSWRLHQDLALFHVYFFGAPRRASEILLEAAERPGAPPYFRPLAAALLAQGGERAAAREMWTRIYEQAEPGPMKDNAAIRRAMLDALDAVDALNAASRAFAARAGRPGRSLEELREAGLVRGHLADPTGAPFAYDPGTGTAAIARQSILWRANY